MKKLNELEFLAMLMVTGLILLITFHFFTSHFTYH